MASSNKETPSASVPVQTAPGALRALFEAEAAPVSRLLHQRFEVLALRAWFEELAPIEIEARLFADALIIEELLQTPPDRRLALLQKSAPPAIQGELLVLALCQLKRAAAFAANFPGFERDLEQEVVVATTIRALTECRHSPLAWPVLDNTTPSPAWAEALEAPGTLVLHLPGVPRRLEVLAGLALKAWTAMPGGARSPRNSYYFAYASKSLPGAVAFEFLPENGADEFAVYYAAGQLPEDVRSSVQIENPGRGSVLFRLLLNPRFLESRGAVQPQIAVEQLDGVHAREELERITEALTHHTGSVVMEKYP